MAERGLWPEGFVAEVQSLPGVMAERVPAIHVFPDISVAVPIMIWQRDHWIWTIPVYETSGEDPSWPEHPAGEDVRDGNEIATRPSAGANGSAVEYQVNRPIHLPGVTIWV